MKFDYSSRFETAEEYTARIKKENRVAIIDTILCTLTIFFGMATAILFLVAFSPAK